MVFFKFFCMLVILCINMYGQNDKLDTILKNKTLKVCIWTNYYGISYLDKRTQKLIGIDSDLAQELANDLEVNLEFIPSSFPTFINDINSDKCDIAMFAIGNTKSRREKVRFTTAHLQSDIYGVTTKTSSKIRNWKDIDKKDVVVAVAKGTYHETVMREKLQYADLLVVTNNGRAQEVKAGRADLFMSDYPFGKRMLAKTDWAKLILPHETYHMTPYAWTMAYGNDKFYNRVEKFIIDIKKDGRLLHFAKKNGLEAIVKID